MIPASRLTLAALGAAAIATIAACTGGSTPAPIAQASAAPSSAPASAVAAPTLAPTPTPAPTPAATPRPTATPEPTWGAFVSKRHGYSADVPPGWMSREYMGEWVSLKDFGPGKEVPGEDVIALPDYSAFLIVNAMDVPKGMTPAEWQTAFDAIVAAGITADCPIATSTGTLAGESAEVGEQTCDGSVIVGRSLVRDGRGYYFTIRYPEGDSATQKLLERVLESIAFTGS